MNTKKIVILSSGCLLKEAMGSFKDILVRFGKEEEVRKLDEEYQQKKESGPWGMEEVAKLYAGISEADLRQEATRHCREDLAEGAKEAIGAIKQMGCIVGAITASPKFVMDALKEALGLDFAFGTELEFVNGTATGNISVKIDRFGKAELLKQKIAELEAEKDNVILIGDSITDLPMAELAGKFIAFNTDIEDVKQKAQAVIQGKLTDILNQI